MKLSFPLPAQILTHLCVYLSVLVIGIFLIFNSQFGIGWNALFESPIGERFEVIADGINSQLQNASTSNWNEILRSFSKMYKVKLYLFDVHGTQWAGDPIELPPRVLPTFHGHFPRLLYLETDMRRGYSLPMLSSAPQDMAIAHSVLAIACQNLMGHSPAKVQAGLEPERVNFLGFAPSTFPGPVPPAPPPPLAPFGFNLPPLPLTASHAHGRFLVHTEVPNCFWLGVRLPLYIGGADKSVPGILLASSENLWQTSILLDLRSLAGFAAALSGFTLIFWLPFVYRLSRSLWRLTTATERIAEGRFDTRLKAGSGDEIGRLGEAVNTLAARLNNFVTGQKRFLGDIAHELCTPIARLQVALEMLEDADVAERQVLVRDINEDVNEMSALVNELLAYSRAGLADAKIQLTEVDVNDLVKRAVSKLNANNIRIESQGAPFVLGDQMLLERAISNVLRNSIRYAGERAPITVRVSSAGAAVHIIISDTGPGIPSDALNMLGEPFFRPEPSRSRDSGGVGLGLAIVKSCTEACGGTVRFRNLASGGFEVDFRLTHYPVPTATV